MSKRDNYGVLEIAINVSVERGAPCNKLTMSGFFASVDVQHPVLARASAGLFVGVKYAKSTN